MPQDSLHAGFWGHILPRGQRGRTPSSMESACGIMSQGAARCLLPLRPASAFSCSTALRPAGAALPVRGDSGAARVRPRSAGRGAVPKKENRCAPWGKPLSHSLGPPAPLQGEPWSAFLGIRARSPRHGPKRAVLKKSVQPAARCSPLPLQSGCMARALRPAGPPRPHRDKRTAPARRGLFFYGPVALYLMSIPPKTQLAFR